MSTAMLTLKPTATVRLFPRLRRRAMPSDAIRDLIAGYRDFRAAHFDARRDARARDGGASGARCVRSTLRELSERGQNPRALVVACCDSRADPAIVFDTAPGDVFVVRNVANLVPPYTGVDFGHHGTCAAVEYSVAHLEVPLIVVMGHTQCGGAAAGLRKYGGDPNGDPAVFAANEATGEGFIGSWVALTKTSVREVCEKYDPDIRARMLEHELVRNSVRNLATFPFVRERMDKGTLEVIGAVFNVFDGTLTILDAETGEFVAPDIFDDDARASGGDDVAPDAKRAKAA